VSKVLKIRPREFKRVFHLTERFATTAQALVTRGHFWPHFGRILFAAGCFRTSSDVAVDVKTRVIPRKLSFDVAMQNAQNVFESLQGHLPFPNASLPFFTSRHHLAAKARLKSA